MQNREIAGNRDTGLLKLLALACMIIDHVGARILPNITELRVIGRVAFPLYIWCMAVGACYTRSPLKYALRLLVVGLIAQPFYMLGLRHTWQQWNIFITLLLGYMGIWGIRENRWGSRYWAPLLCLLATFFVTVDYGWKGVLLVMLLYLARGSRGSIAAVMIAFCLFWGRAGGSAVTSLFGLDLRDALGKLYNFEMVKSFLNLQTFALLSLPLMLWRRAKRTPFPRWAAYAAYPGHLLILWLVQLALGITVLQNDLARLIPWM